MGGNNTWAGPITVSNQVVDAPDAFPSTPFANMNAGFFGVDAGSQLTVTGNFNHGSDVVFVGGGTLTLGGVFPDSAAGESRIFNGTVIAQKVPGIPAVNGSNVNTILIGDDNPAHVAKLIINSNQQLPLASINGENMQVATNGTFQVNGGFGDSIINLTLESGPNGAGQVSLGSGSSLTLTGTVTLAQLGNGNSTGGSISGGTLAFNFLGQSAAHTTTFTVNDAATGDDLTVTSSLVDGSGLVNTNLTKAGQGTLVLGGSTGNTYSGTTTINEGTIAFAKSSGLAIGGALIIGDSVSPVGETALAGGGTGYQNSDVAVCAHRQPGSLPYRRRHRAAVRA